MKKISSCPFCGSKKVNINRTNQWACWVSCDNCFASASSNPKREEAIKNWNRRRKPQLAKIVIDDDLEVENEKS